MSRVAIAGVTVVVPAYNEEGAITETVEAIREVFAGGEMEHEVLVVDDGSSDSTAERARSAGATMLRHPHNLGYGRSLKDGIREAKYDVIVITDADGTYPIEQIPVLLEEFAKGFDMVVGARQGYKDSIFKSPMRKALKWLVEFTAGRSIPDANSGLRIFRKSTVLPYLRTLCDTFSFTTSLTLAYMMTGRFVTYLPIRYDDRVGTTKVRLFKDSLRTLQYIVQAVLYYNPLKLFILFSVACVFLSFLGFAGSAFFGLLSGFLLGIGGLLVALLVFCCGLLADLLRQIMPYPGIND